MPRRAKPKPVILPKVASKLINLAVDDLEEVERDDCYRVYMGNWHNVRRVADHSSVDNETYVCAVCFAGAVMAKTLNACSIKNLEPANFKGNKPQLCALDDFREGGVTNGLERLGVSRLKRKVIPDRPVADYGSDAGAFKRDMRKLARDLAKVGL